MSHHAFLPLVTVSPDLLPVQFETPAFFLLLPLAFLFVLTAFYCRN